MSSYDKQSTTCQQLKSDTAMTIYGKQDTKVSNIKHHPAMTVNGKQNTTYHNRRSHNIMSISCRKIKACPNLNPNIACQTIPKSSRKIIEASEIYFCMTTQAECHVRTEVLTTVLLLSDTYFTLTCHLREATVSKTYIGYPDNTNISV